MMQSCERCTHIWNLSHCAASAWLRRIRVKTIRLAHVCLALICFVAAPAAAFAQAGDQSLQQEIERLRAELDTLRKQYEERLAALEARVSAANQAPQAPQAAPAPPTPPLPP